MKPRHLAILATFFLTGCFYSSQPVDSSLGTNCKAQTTGLMFLSRPDVTCEQPAQPPLPEKPPEAKAAVQ